MPHVKGDSRNQLRMFSPELAVAPDSFVRAIDAFVDSIDLKSFGFKRVDSNEDGRPSYHPSTLLKLYIYGYQYGIRSSRKLEREAQFNIETIWLLQGQMPRYHTIADFRKNHPKAFRQVFRRFVYLLRQCDLIEGQTLGVDSFKVRAQNSLKNNFNEKKIARHLEYIDQKISEYEQAMDQTEASEERMALEQKIANQKQKHEQYEQLNDLLKASGKEQISLTDVDARAVVLHRNIVNVGYNIQASTDAKHKLLVEYETGDVNDTHALAAICTQTKETLQLDEITVVADKGYHTGEELYLCQQNNITTFVSPKAPASNDTELFPITLFVYDKLTDTYTCPAGQTLSSNNRWLEHSGKGHSSPFRFKRYTTAHCKTCSLLNSCTKSKNQVRAIDRSEYAPAIEANNQRVIQNPDYYRQRQQITEHIFGTLKRQRGFTYTLLKGKEKVLGEVGLMFIGYNLSRCVKILGMDAFYKILKDSILINKRPQIDAFSNEFYAYISEPQKIAA